MSEIIYFRAPSRQDGVVGNGFVAYLVAVLAGLGFIVLGAFCVLSGIVLIWIGLQILP